MVPVMRGFRAQSGSEHSADSNAAWQPVRPTFDNPVSWSLPIGDIRGISIRLHAAIPAFIAIELGRRLVPPRVAESDPADLSLTALMLVCLLISASAHACGGAAVCRRLGGTLRELHLWPLGGLFPGHVEHLPGGWRSAFLAASAGPLTNLAVFLLLMPVLGLMTGVWWMVALPSPLAPPGVGDLAVDGRQPWWLLAMGTFHRINFIVMLLVLLPIEPLDGSRVMRALFRRTGSPAQASVRSARIGVWASILLVSVGIVLGAWVLIVLALCGLFLGVQRLRNEAWLEAQCDLSTISLSEEDDSVSDADCRSEDGADRHDASEAEELDRVLARIGQHGMEGLTAHEREVLRRGTERRRGNGGGTAQS